MRSIYIAGPMTGYPSYNFPAFHSAAQALRARGFLVHNPADKESDEHGLPDPAKMPLEWGGLNPEITPGSIRQRDYEELLKRDTIALLPGWEKSAGALGEALVAQQTGKRLCRLGIAHTLLPLTPQWVIRTALVWEDRGWQDCGNSTP